MFNRASHALVLILLVFNFLSFGHLAVAKAVDATKTTKKERAAEFSLKDQFGNEFAYKFPKEKISILAFADKEGSEQLENWIRPLVEKYEDRIDIQGVAELSSVPGLARGIVRNILKKKSPRAVMLDWSGDVSKSYNYQKDQANIIVIDKQGNIIAKAVGGADDAKLARIYKEIDALIR